MVNRVREAWSDTDIVALKADLKPCHWCSWPVKIGGTYWHVMVVDFYLGGRCTVYEWLDKGSWCDSHQWPTYDTNDTYDGLPIGLAKLYDKNKSAIEQAMQV